MRLEYYARTQVQSVRIDMDMSTLIADSTRLEIKHPSVMRRVRAWFEDVAKSRVSFDLQIEKVETIEFVDEDGSEIKFVVRAYISINSHVSLKNQCTQIHDEYSTRASPFEHQVRNGQLQEWVEGKCELEEVKKLQIRDDGTIYDGHELIPLRAGDVSRVVEWLLRVRSRTSCRVDHYESVRCSISHLPITQAHSNFSTQQYTGTNGEERCLQGRSCKSCGTQDTFRILTTNVRYETSPAVYTNTIIQT